jgi:hypothetical protein
MHLDQELIDNIAGHRALNLEALENKFWKLRCELVQAIGKFRRVARERRLKFADIPIIPERDQSVANAEMLGQKEAEFRHQLEQMPPEVRALGGRCLEIDELLVGVKFQLIKSLESDGQDVDSIAKRLAMSLQSVADISNTS